MPVGSHGSRAVRLPEGRRSVTQGWTYPSLVREGRLTRARVPTSDSVGRRLLVRCVVAGWRCRRAPVIRMALAFWLKCADLTV